MADQISYSVDQAAESTGVSDTVIRRAMRAGDLIARYPVIDGESITKPLIYRADLDEWIRRAPTAPRKKS